MILYNQYEDEVIENFYTFHKQPALESPSLWGKQMSIIYTEEQSWC